jgi:hypothetical protein
MITIVMTKDLLNMLPPMDEEIACNLRLLRYGEESDALFKVLSVYLSLFALFYLTMRIYLS